MDSLTQFVLGAAVSTVLLGKKLGPRKAALIGGALGTLPDLDVLIPYDDPIDSFVYHRGWTHSVLCTCIGGAIVGRGADKTVQGPEGLPLADLAHCLPVSCHPCRH